MSMADELLRLLARALAPLIAAELREATGPIEYSTCAGSWPPRCRNRRMARERIRAVPGHEQSGKGKATVWRVSVEAYRRHHVTAATALTIVPTTITDEMIADEAIASSPLRKTRRVA